VLQTATIELGDRVEELYNATLAGLDSRVKEPCMSELDRRVEDLIFL